MSDSPREYTYHHKRFGTLTCRIPHDQMSLLKSIAEEHKVYIKVFFNVGVECFLDEVHVPGEEH